MKLYEKLATPPKNALRIIQGGRLKGKSDINPQWRYEVMTSEFGTCGIGWKYEVVNREFVSSSENQIAVFVDINLYIKVDSEWSEPIPANGGSMFIAKESSGLYTSDEAVKMATTDALGTAMKMIGVAADIYRGATKNLPPQTKDEKSDKKDQQKPEKKKVKLPDNKFNDAVEFLKGGKTMEELKSHYEFNQDTEFKLIAASEL